jgi:hypothetical protein
MSEFMIWIASSKALTLPSYFDKDPIALIRADRH